MNPKELDPKKLETLRREIQIGLDDEARGAVVDGEGTFARLLERRVKHLGKFPVDNPVTADPRKPHE